MTGVPSICNAKLSKDLTDLQENVCSSTWKIQFYLAEIVLEVNLECKL